MNSPNLSEAAAQIAAPVPDAVAKKLGRKRPKNPAAAPEAPSPVAELRRLVGLHKRLARTIQSWSSPIKDRKFKKGNETIVVKCALAPAVIDDAKRAIASLKANQEDLVKAMAPQLRQIPIYTEFLQKVYGVGPVTAAYLCAMVDIRRCPNVSNLIRYCGNAVDYRTGKRENRSSGPKYSPDGKFDSSTFGTFNSDLRRNNYLILTTMRKCSAKALKDAPNGVTTKYLERWAQASHLRRSTGRTLGADAAGRKKATDLFLWDLYVMWRTLEGLDIRPDKYSAVRGRWHGGGECVDQRYTLTLDEAREIVGNPAASPAAEKLVWKDVQEDSDADE